MTEARDLHRRISELVAAEIGCEPDQIQELYMIKNKIVFDVKGTSEKTRSSFEWENLVNGW